MLGPLPPSQKHLKEGGFETDVGRASLSEKGHKGIAVLVRVELSTTAHHRDLGVLC
ncbi:hypothetical protein ACIP88_16790 [Streptomyces uncialis]|uniref:hypothetical protein n=1 Tax=Streptomyces uncialis TaxID=1048205 RepID=UPI00381008DD